MTNCPVNVYEYNITVPVLLRNYVPEGEPEAIRAPGGDHIGVPGVDRWDQNGEVKVTIADLQYETIDKAPFVL